MRPSEAQTPTAHDVFLSYGREDAEFVHQVIGELQTVGLQAWIDTKGVYGGEKFWPEIEKAIDAAAAMIFVISPHSAASHYCHREVDHAIAAHKRVVPLCRKEVDSHQLPPEIASRQWIFARDAAELSSAREGLRAAVRAEWEWIREHARLLVRAAEWRAAGRDRSLTLRGREVKAADGWLARTPPNHAPSALHIEYIKASHEAARLRALRIGGLAAVAVVVIAVVGWRAARSEIASLTADARATLGKGDVSFGDSLLARAEALCARTPFAADLCGDVVSNRADVLLKGGKYDESIERLSKVIDVEGSLTPTDAQAPGRRAEAFRSRAYARIMGAERLADSGSRDRAYGLALDDIASATRLEEQYLGVASAQRSALTRARVFIGRGEYGLALGELDIADGFADKDAHTIEFLRALAYHCSGDTKRGEAALLLYRFALPNPPQEPQLTLNFDYYKEVTDRCLKGSR